MESALTKKARLFRGKVEIVRLLRKHEKSGLSILAFCAANQIAQSTFHKWKKKYSEVSGGDVESSGFSRLQITSTAVEAALFAEVNGIRIYQPVGAAYLKELLP
jgi:hypothetical protein